MIKFLVALGLFSPFMIHCAVALVAPHGPELTEERVSVTSSNMEWYDELEVQGCLQTSIPWQDAEKPSDAISHCTQHVYGG